MGRGRLFRPAGGGGGKGEGELRCDAGDETRLKRAAYDDRLWRGRVTWLLGAVASDQGRKHESEPSTGALLEWSLLLEAKRR